MLNKYLISVFLISLFPYPNAFAARQVKAGGGIHFADGFKTDALSSRNQKPLLRSSNGFGIQAFVAQQFSFLTFGVGGQYTYHKSKSQYDYTDPDKVNNKANVTDLLTSAYFYNIDLKVSADLLSIGNLHFFIAGGPSIGFGILAFDQDDFYNKNQSSNGRIEGNSDIASLVGYLAEAGFEYRGREFGGQLKVAYHNSKSSKFKSLANSRITYEEKAIVFNFLRILK